MSDLIDRQAAIEALAREDCLGYIECEADKIYKAIDAIPSADRPTGHWIENDNGTFSCSNCQSWIPKEQHHYARHCLYCGARMESEEE